jgi:hypothetical protein
VLDPDLVERRNTAVRPRPLAEERVVVGLGGMRTLPVSVAHDSFQNEFSGRSKGATMVGVEHSCAPVALAGWPDEKFVPALDTAVAGRSEAS